MYLVSSNIPVTYGNSWPRSPALQDAKAKIGDQCGYWVSGAPLGGVVSLTEIRVLRVWIVLYMR